MKLSSTFLLRNLFFFLFCSHSLLFAQILEQDFDHLSSLNEFQGNPPGVGQVDSISLKPANDNSDIFSLGSREGDKFLLINKNGNQMRHFDRRTGINQAEFLKISFTFSVTEANQNKKFAALYVGNDLYQRSFIPQRKERWGQIGIYANSNRSFYLTTEVYLNDRNPNFVLPGMQSSSFSGEHEITIFINSSENDEPLAYVGLNGEYNIIPKNMIDVWVGDRLVISGFSYDYMNQLEGEPKVNAFKFLVLNTDLVATAELDDLLITADVEAIPMSEMESQPVELTTISARKSGKDVKLEWQTASEKNSSHFEVERSLDGQEFEKIGVVAASGNSNNELNYFFLDKDASLKFSGILYYRLHQVDLDGTSEFSPTVSVKLPGVKTVIKKVYPNPFKENFKVSLLTDKTLMLRFRLMNLQGKAVMENICKVEPAEQEQLFQLIPSEGLPSGVYILEVKASGEKQRYRLMKL